MGTGFDFARLRRSPKNRFLEIQRDCISRNRELTQDIQSGDFFEIPLLLNFIVFEQRDCSRPQTFNGNGNAIPIVLKKIQLN